jgi:hypothetical protein
MRYRAMALVAASLLFATQCYAAVKLNTSRSNIYRAGSTTSGGHHGGGGGAGAAKSTTLNSSKSNSFRMGGGGGGKGASGNAVKLNSSRSN